MAVSPERKVPAEEVVRRPEEVEVSEDLQKEGVTPTLETPKAQIEDRGRLLVESEETKKITIEVPADQEKLKSWSKGSIKDSITWLGRHGLRMLKKALHFGWRTVFGGS